MPERWEIPSGAAVGTDGSATVTKISSNFIRGFVTAIYVKYSGGKPATTDVVVSTAGESHPAITLLTLTDKNTDGWFFVRQATCSNVGAADGGTTAVEIWDKVKIVVTGANSGDVVTVTLMVEP